MNSDASKQVNHDHDFTVATATQESKVRAVFWLTTITMVAEIIAGTWFGSMALLADGWHMGTHSAAFAIALFAYYYANKNADNPRFSFGTGKVTYLGGFASAVALAVVALIMAIESLMRFIEPQTILFNQAITVACLGLAVNIASVFLLHSGDHDHHHHDHTLKAAYFHVLADALTSITAIIALVAGKYLGWIWMDAMMGIVGSVVIARWAYGLLRQTSKPLLDENPYLEEKYAIERALQHNENLEIVDFHIWQISPHHRAGIIGLVSDNPQQPEDYRQLLLKSGFNFDHLTIEVHSK